MTVVDTQGSTPRKAGARMLLGEHGQTLGTVGGGTVEHAVQAMAVEVLARGEPALRHFKLTHELAMCCGGQMTFFLEPLVRPPPLLILGCGHVGRAVIQAAAPLGYAITAVDDVESNLHRVPAPVERLCSYDPGDLRALPFGDDAAVLIATREHRLDQRLLELCLTQRAAYVGVIGSQRKARMQRERLLAKGLDPTTVERVRCPVGLDIGAETPEEIAVAVCAELIALRRLASPQQVC